MIERQYYRCQHCGHREFEFDRRVGWKHEQSGKLRNWVALLCQAMPYTRSQEMLRELTGVHLAHRTLESITEQIGRALREQQAQEQQTDPKPAGPSGADCPGIVCVVIDAVKVHLQPEWRDVKVATIFEWRPGKQERKGDRINPEYVVGMEHWQLFGRRVERAARLRGSHSGARVVVVGDGAEWIVDLAQAHFPHAEFILDWYHAMEHLWLAGKALYGEHSPRTAAWVKQRETEMWNGQLKKVLAAMGYAQSGLRRRHDARQANHASPILAQTSRYFRRRAKSMAYDRYRAQGLFIGSGTVEAACKTLVIDRTRQSGMRWKEDGLLNVLALRAVHRSGHWHIFDQGLLAA